jgi:hypothetical protein
MTPRDHTDKDAAHDLVLADDRLAHFVLDLHGELGEVFGSQLADGGFCHGRSPSAQTLVGDG